jgi:hypothetical protein
MSTSREAEAMTTSTGAVLLLCAVLGLFISWRLAEIPMLLLCGAALERGISEVQDGTGGWGLIVGALAYIATYLWRHWEILKARK